MVSTRPQMNPANVVESLVYALLDVFDETRDLYKTLRIKEKRDHDQIQRLKGYPDPRKTDYLDEDDIAGDESIVLDKAAVTRTFEVGLEGLGKQYAVGDVITQTALQSQIIALQSSIIQTFLYGPSSPEPISHHLSVLLAASRSAGTTSVDALSTQQQRMLSALPPSARPNGPAPPPPYPVTVPPSSDSSTALVKSKRSSWPDSHSTHQTPTLQSLATRPKANRTDTESTSFSGPTSYGTQTVSNTMYCLYALDLQRHPRQPLSETITTNAVPYCPYCNCDLNLSPGRSWEISKDSDVGERIFRIQNRFVVKCHRERTDQGYSCVICDHSSDVGTVCGDVKALIRHIWMDHSVGELQAEEDISEVIEKAPDRRRDSGIGRSRSVGHGKRRSRMEREVDVLEIRRNRDR